MINSASVSKDGCNVGTRGHPSRRGPVAAPQDEDFFRFAVFFFLTAAFVLTARFALSAFGRLRRAARCAAARAALAQPVSSSGSSYSRSGSCQYESTVTVLVRV